MKKNLLRSIALIAAVCIIAFSFAACQNTANDPSPSPSAPAQSNVLVMGTNAQFPPFEFIAEKGIVDKFDGIDVAIAKEIADDLGMELKIEDMEFDSIIPSLKTGKVDIGIAGMTVKPDRLENVDFTIPYYVATQVMIVNKDSEISKATDLKDKKVGVVNAYTGDSVITGMNITDKIERYKKGLDAVIELNNGKLDAVIIDAAPAGAMIKNYPDLKLVEDSEAFETEEYAMAVQKGNKELLDKVNASLEKMLESDRIAEISEQYIQSEE